MRLLLIGRGGQLGRELEPALAALGEMRAHDRATLDLARPEQIREAVRAARPQVIVNAAAYTAVDRAESEPERAHEVNAVAPGVLAEEAARSGALLVHYSTDYVFDGLQRTPYRESDPPRPINVYGQTKLAGERAIEAVGGRHLILRTSWVYAAHGQNFLRTMLRLAAEREVIRVVADQRGAPTSARWLAEATTALIRQALDTKASGGVYHATCAGETSWYDFARAIFAHLPPGRPVRVEPIGTAAYPTPARRPAYSVLSHLRLRGEFGIVPPAWEAGLEAEVKWLVAQGREACTPTPPLA